MRRWVITMVSALFLLLLAVPAFASDYQAVDVEVDGSKLTVSAYLVDGRTMVPMRAIFERLNATIEWDDVRKSATAMKGTTKVQLWIGRTDAQSGDHAVTLDVPPMLINGSTYVPLRFVSESLGAEVSFDSERNTAVVATNSGCTHDGGQTHSGTIQPGGETWGVCGSPHFVKGDFIVSGKDSPVLTIEAGAVVHFEQAASIRIGEDAPGGLVVEGTEEQPVVLTADTAGAEPGFWRGIQFFSQTVKGRASLEHARIEYAGDISEGAVGVHSDTQPLSVMMNDTEIKNSLYAGMLLQGLSQLTLQSNGLHITGTKASAEGGGAPIITGVYGTNRLPDGDYTGNDADQILIAPGTSTDTVTRNTIWRNVGVPYHSETTVVIEGAANPLLTVEPGVTANWSNGYGMRVGEAGRGGLHAVGTAEQPVTFSSELARPGTWEGLYVGDQAGEVNVQYAVIEYARQGVSFWQDMGPVIQNCTIRSNEEYGIAVLNEDSTATDFRSGLGNTFKNNGEDQHTD
ncbi:stalk domain-containing protein [Paenibacillus hexagrammi]|uniref:Right-handed parallel beta-helix repeat-containing protein n=1 Tax=Paenibacillus hexagrammi TaxID=2908839 RepID=A0ABY3SIV8_9BACL|nr:stalk domain-containing protein [Paenibacillus sp. YPD9-1]UJF33974.1 right-handed parallel beta-helix repeat-containing protein [Paenibacillus sp. YPD9-1]